MEPLNINKTYTTIFMLAALFNNDTTYNNILQDDFIDSHISDFYRPEHDGCILIVKSKNTIPKNTITPLITKYKNDTDYVFVYDIPNKFKDDYTKIMNGDFINISKDYKERLLEFWESDNTTKLYDLLINAPKKLAKIHTPELFREIYRIQAESDM